MSYHPTTRVDTYGGPAVSGAFTWNKFLLAKWVDILMISPGGGGSSGGLTAGTLGGGNGAQGGAIAYYSLPAAMLPLTVAVFVGAGGIAGIWAGAGSVAGGPGGNCTFGNFMAVYGGTNAFSNINNKGFFSPSSDTVVPVWGLDGGQGQAVTAGNAAAAMGGAGGGKGGAITALVAAAGVAGGDVGIPANQRIPGRTVILAGGAAGAIGAAGGNGGSLAVGGMDMFGGSGGGGGGASTTIAVAGGKGGDGGWPGGAGGGGGSIAAPATVAGNGGAGANGFILVITHF